MSEKYEFLNDNTLQFPGSPCRWTTGLRLKAISIITMSCGGGMGGAQWKEYVDRLPNILLEEGRMIEVRDAVSGEAFAINPRFVVNISNCHMAEADCSSSNSNFAQFREAKWDKDEGEVVFTVRGLVRDGSGKVYLNKSSRFPKELEWKRGWTV